MLPLAHVGSSPVLVDAYIPLEEGRILSCRRRNRDRRVCRPNRVNRIMGYSSLQGSDMKPKDEGIDGKGDD